MACEFHEHFLFRLSAVEKLVKQLAVVMEEQQSVCSEDEMCAKLLEEVVLLGKRIGSEMCVKVLLLLVSLGKRFGLKVEPEKLLPDVDGDLDVSREWENVHVSQTKLVGGLDEMECVYADLDVSRELENVHAKLVGGSDEAECYQPTMSDLRLPDLLLLPPDLLFPLLLGTLASEKLKRLHSPWCQSPRLCRADPRWVNRSPL